eukprot:3634149-Amphidinium_carterae.1
MILWMSCGWTVVFAKRRIMVVQHCISFCDLLAPRYCGTCECGVFYETLMMEVRHEEVLEYTEREPPHKCCAFAHVAWSATCSALLPCCFERGEGQV